MTTSVGTNTFTPEGFFRDNSVLWTDLNDCDLVVGGGDVNARTKNLCDFIPDIDGNLVPERLNPDMVTNSHGKSFIQFLKDNRAVILNGRVTPQNNDFTFLSPRGRSVPDYLWCSLEHLNYCKSFEVKSVSEVIESYHLVPPTNLPDHSILVGTFDISNCNFQPTLTTAHVETIDEQEPAIKKPKKNIRKIDEQFFLSDEIKEVVQELLVIYVVIMCI